LLGNCVCTTVGKEESSELGSTDAYTLGTNVGVPGVAVGDELKVCDGIAVDIVDGNEVCTLVGVVVGVEVGANVGTIDGFVLGVLVKMEEGNKVGITVGLIV